MTISRDRVDAILDEAHAKGHHTVELSSREEADELVTALIERAESIADDEQAICCSGYDRTERYILRIDWVAKRGPTC